MIYTKRIAIFAAVGCVLAVCLALAGCQWGNGARVCSENRCATIAPNSSTAGHTVTAVPVTVTATPDIPGATAPVPDTADAVFICLGQYPSRYELAMLAQEGSQQQQDLVACLRIPPAQVQAFYVIVAQDAQGHDFGSRQGRHDFAAQTLADDAQRCHAGQAS